MLRRLSYPFVLCCLAAIPLYLTSRSNEAADPPAAPAKQTQAAPPAPDVFALPEGNDEKALHLFLTRITQTPPEADTPEGELAHYQKMDKAVAEVLKRDVGDEFFSNVAQLRLQLLAILKETGDKNADAAKEAFIKQLSESPRPVAKGLVKRIQMQSKLLKFSTDTPEEQQKMIDQIAEALKSTPKDNDSDLQLTLEVAMSIGTVLDRTSSPLTVTAYKKFSEALTARDEPRLAGLLQELNGIVTRLELPGKEIEFTGTDVTGKPFDLKSYRGKVVLVDFWATWCGPCVQEMPHLQQIYKAYHGKGFEVVGISGDNEKEDLTKFIAENNVPWVNIFEEASENKEQESVALTTKYGISAFPTMLLVNREGKVVTVQQGGFHGTANNTTMEAELEKLLGPLPGATEPPAEQQVIPAPKGK